MISVAKRKLLRQLERKSVRDREGLFVAEGVKTVGDLLRGGLECRYLAATSAALESLPALERRTTLDEASEAELADVSSLQTRPEVVGIFRQPHPEAADLITADVTLALDEVQDPGNLGTILRTADWFGVRSVALSPTCADAYGPKAVQASRGALCRVHPTVCDLLGLLRDNASGPRRTVVGTLLEGRDISRTPAPSRCIVLMGNEGRGLSTALRDRIDLAVTIPSYPAGEATSESLNVAVATGIALQWLRGGG